MAGIELYSLAKDLLAIKNKQEVELWTDGFTVWKKISGISP